MTAQIVNVDLTDPELLEELGNHTDGVEAAVVNVLIADPNKPGHKLRAAIWINVSGVVSDLDVTMSVIRPQKPSREFITAIRPFIEVPP